MSKGITPRRWRIEFCTDLTRGEAAVIPLGFLVEAAWPKRARWLGLIFRRQLTRVELDHVNLATWRELEEPEPFMRGLFQQAWDAGHTGTVDLASRYPAFSALRFGEENATEIELSAEPRDGQVGAYAHLVSLADQLAPVLTAPVIQLPARKPLVPDVEFDTRQSTKAA